TVTVLPQAVAPEFVLANHPTICSANSEMIELSAIGGSGDEIIWTIDRCEGSVIGTGPSLAVAAPLSTTSYFAHWQGICGRSSCASMTVTVVEAPSVSAAGPYAACAVNSVSIAGAATAYSSVQWMTSGTGTFANASSLATTYTPSAAD